MKLKQYNNWRRKLDDEWEQEFTVDGKRWLTVEHYYQASKFRKRNPDFYNLFSLDSDDQISKNIEIAKAVGSIQGVYKNKGNTIVTRPSDIKIDPDFYGTRRKDEEREKALYAKFSKNEDLKKILKHTKQAVLQRYIRKAQPEKDILLMKVRNRIQSE